MTQGAMGSLKTLARKQGRYRVEKTPIDTKSERRNLYLTPVNQKCQLMPTYSEVS